MYFLLPRQLAVTSRWSARRTSLIAIQLLLLFCLVLMLYREVLRTLPAMWISHDRLEGFLVPLVSLFLVWRTRHQLAALPLTPSLIPGASVLVLAGILLLLAKVGAAYILQEISLLFAIIGLVLLLLGPTHLRALSLPIGLLGFMLTIFEDIVTPLHWPFQLITARQGAVLLNFIGLPALLDRQFIILPHITLEVARVCSGVNYLISVLAIALPLAHLLLRSWLGRIALILSAVAIGIVGNWARIVLIALWSTHGGQGLHGPFHVLQGMFVAWVGYIFLFFGSWLFCRVERRLLPCPSERSLSALVAKATGAVTLPRKSLHSFTAWHRAWVVAVVVLTTLSVYLFFHAERPTPLQMDLVAFPPQIDEWTGQTLPIQDAPVRVGGADTELFRAYRNRNGDAVHLYVGYLSSQGPGKKIPNDATTELHGHANRAAVRLGTGESIVINDRREAAGQVAGRLLFWYQADGHIIADRYRMKLATIRRSLLFGRTHAAFVAVQLHSQGDRDSERPSKESEGFVRALVPTLRAYLP